MNVIPFPLGLADAKRGFAVILAPDDSLEYLELSDGHSLWSLEGLRWPIAIGETRVLARDLDAPNNVLSLCVVALDDGRLIGKCEPVPLPYWTADVAVSASADGDVFSVDWLAERQYRGGAPPPKSLLAKDGERASGSVRIQGKKIIARDESPRDVPDTRVAEATIRGRTYTLIDSAIEARKGDRVVWTKRWTSSPDPPTAPR